MNKKFILVIVALMVLGSLKVNAACTPVTTGVTTKTDSAGNTYKLYSCPAAETAWVYQAPSGSASKYGGIYDDTGNIIGYTAALTGVPVLGEPSGGYGALSTSIKLAAPVATPPPSASNLVSAATPAAPPQQQAPNTQALIPALVGNGFNINAVQPNGDIILSKDGNTYVLGSDGKLSSPTANDQSLPAAQKSVDKAYASASAAKQTAPVGSPAGATSNAVQAEISTAQPFAATVNPTTGAITVNIRGAQIPLNGIGSLAGKKLNVVNPLTGDSIELTCKTPTGCSSTDASASVSYSAGGSDASFSRPVHGALFGLISGGIEQKEISSNTNGVTTTDTFLDTNGNKLSSDSINSLIAKSNQITTTVHTDFANGQQTDSRTEIIIGAPVTAKTASGQMVTTYTPSGRDLINCDGNLCVLRHDDQSGTTTYYNCVGTAECSTTTNTGACNPGTVTSGTCNGPGLRTQWDVAPGFVGAGQGLAKIAAPFAEAGGLQGVSSSWFGAANTEHWAEQVEATFASAFLGESYIESAICKAWRAPSDTDINAAFTIGPTGQADQVVTLQGERLEMRTRNETTGTSYTQYIYRMEPYVQIARDSASFNVCLQSANDCKNIFNQSVQVVTGSNGSLSTYSARGTNAIIINSLNKYANVCINFDKAPSPSCTGIVSLFGRNQCTTIPSQFCVPLVTQVNPASVTTLPLPQTPGVAAPGTNVAGNVSGTPAPTPSEEDTVRASQNQQPNRV